MANRARRPSCAIWSSRSLCVILAFPWTVAALAGEWKKTPAIKQSPENFFVYETADGSITTAALPRDKWDCREEGESAANGTRSLGIACTFQEPQARLSIEAIDYSVRSDYVIRNPLVLCKTIYSRTFDKMFDEWSFTSLDPGESHGFPSAEMSVLGKTEAAGETRFREIVIVVVDHVLLLRVHGTAALVEAKKPLVARWFKETRFATVERNRLFPGYDKGIDPESFRAVIAVRGGKSLLAVVQKEITLHAKYRRDGREFDAAITLARQASQPATHESLAPLESSGYHVFHFAPVSAEDAALFARRVDSNDGRISLLADTQFEVPMGDSENLPIAADETLEMVVLVTRSDREPYAVVSSETVKGSDLLKHLDDTLKSLFGP